MGTKQTVTLTPSQQSRVDGFFESRRGGKTFRRSDISDLLFETTRPKDHHRSVALAEAAIAQAAAQKLIERSGKLHWVFVERTRKTKIGPVAELLNVVEVKITTRVPEKWAIVDMETGEVYMPDKKGELKKAIMETRHQVVAAIQGT